MNQIIFFVNLNSLIFFEVQFISRKILVCIRNSMKLHFFQEYYMKRDICLIQETLTCSQICLFSFCHPIFFLLRIEINFFGHWFDSPCSVYIYIGELFVLMWIFLCELIVWVPSNYTHMTNNRCLRHFLLAYSSVYDILALLLYYLCICYFSPYQFILTYTPTEFCTTFGLHAWTSLPKQNF